MKMLTYQEVLEKSCKGVIRQGKPAMAVVANGETTTKSCAYRGEGGTKCAAGHLIEGDVPKGLNTCPVSAVASFLYASGVDTDDDRMYGLVHTLQNCHDGASSFQDFVSEFKKRVRQNIRLDYTTLNLSFLDQDPGEWGAVGSGGTGVLAPQGDHHATK